MRQDCKVCVSDTCDVLVVGGGAAGIASAIAAARSGADTVLIERYGFLGGMATTALVGAFCGFFTTGIQKRQVVAGIADELVTRLRGVRGATGKRVSNVNPRIASVCYDPELFKFAAERMALEAGVRLHLHTLMVEPLWETPGRLLRGVVIEDKSGRSAILGRMIVDATGDADLASRAGVDYEYGDGQGAAQAMTTIFKVNQVDSGARTEEGLTEEGLRNMRRYLVAAKESGRYQFSRVDPDVFRALPQGTVSVNVTSIPDLNATDASDLTAAEIEGRRQVFEYLRALRDFVPGFGNAQLIAVSPQIGVRETRRIIGEYVLTGEDVLSGAKFDDGIALGAWPVEIHDPQTKRIKWRFIEKEDDYYSIPLRCITPKSPDNLLVVGRCASAAHVAQASTRVMAQALAMGEAAGVVAGLSLVSGRRPTDLPTFEVQIELARRGALLRLPGDTGAESGVG